MKLRTPSPSQRQFDYSYYYLRSTTLHFQFVLLRLLPRVCVFLRHLPPPCPPTSRPRMPCRPAPAAEVSECLGEAEVSDNVALEGHIEVEILQHTTRRPNRPPKPVARSLHNVTTIF